MQVHGAAQGVITIPRRRRRLEALLAIAAIVVIVAMMAVMAVWEVPPATSGVGAEDANPNAGAGSAVVHDDAGNVPSGRYYPLPAGKVVNAGAGSAIVHDDAGNAKPN